ncbi:hypothetical protein JXA32_15600 [Candidatus Sumerlaeota bacterium]|nr:hypothetical protein [Candidatus Sumerlaeota bacterium]
MLPVSEFEDFMLCLENNNVRYLIIGGVAFIFHVKPRYTKDIDIWIECEPENIRNVNKALVEFGSPCLFDEDDTDAVLQVGVEPNRIDLILNVEEMNFEKAWKARVVNKYGAATVNWIGIQDLYEIKSKIDHPRHQSDAMDLKWVLEHPPEKPEK